ncbi:MAG TPA: TetR/AcrR family transcriptional regulator [Cyclobacteriaceae bacterium]|nr:TetR/AcrR family transcriptional regulator [Cyclobacteriaceae bacterium]
MREKIIDVATGLFRLMGVKAVTMDDIARQAGVSKKTIYQEFEDKGALVYEVFAAFLQREEDVLARIIKEEDNVIQHFVRVSKFMREQYSGMNPLILNEIKRYYPKSWKRFEAFKNGMALSIMVDVLKRGKEAGYFRPEIDVEILAMLRLEQIAFDFRSLPSAAHFDMVELQLELFDHFIHGILTEKGRQAYLSESI